MQSGQDRTQSVQQWVRRGFCYTAYPHSGVDISAEVLNWGKQHNLLPLGPAAERVTLVGANVLDVAKIQAAIVPPRLPLVSFTLLRYIMLANIIYGTVGRRKALRHCRCIEL